MKKRYLILINLLISTGVFAQVDVYEGFGYTPGLLGTASGGTGWMPEAGWGGFPRGNGIHQGVAGSSALEVISGGLATPSDYNLTTTEGAIQGTESYGIGFRELAEENRIDMDSGDPVYVSFLFSLRNIAETNGSYNLITFINADRTDLFRLGVTVGSLTANIASGSNASWAAGETITSGETYLYVAKITPGPDQDILSATVYHSGETIGSEPETWEMETVQDISFAIIDRIGLLPGGIESGTADRRGLLDEIRMGASFEAVTGVSDSPTGWAGYPWANEFADVDTGDFLGWVNAALAPWIWIEDLSGWAYAEEEFISDSAGWIWISKEQ